MPTLEQVAHAASSTGPCVLADKPTIDANLNVRPPAVRVRLPNERKSITHRFTVGGHKGYFIVGLYPNGEPGELFITMAKEGSTVSGLMSSFAQVVSISLQHGVPLALLCEKFAHTRFEPSGFTGNPEVPMASSIMDYIFRWLRLRFLNKTESPATAAPRPSPPQALAPVPSLEAPFCVHCGAQMVRSGACFLCHNCGSSSGCG